MGRGILSTCSDFSVQARHYAIWRKTPKTVVNYDPLWSIPTALISPLLRARREGSNVAGGRNLTSHLRIVSAIIHYGQSLKRKGGWRGRGGETKEGRARARKINHCSWWMSHFFSHLSGFSIFTQKGFIFGGKFGGIVVNVHYSDGHKSPGYLAVVPYWHMADMTKWGGREERR